jgi:predicted RNase H-like HicB family nuclease
MMDDEDEMKYDLYLESGPRKRTTMVHVLDLLGCVVHERTTEAALQAAPGAIRQFLRFLSRYGEPVDSDQAIETRIREHVMEGNWLGYGDPTPGFRRDFEPPAVNTLEQGVRRLGWMKEEIIQRLKKLDITALAEVPDHGRSLAAILEHLAESQIVYVRYLVGPLEGTSGLLRTMQKEQGTALAMFRELMDLHVARLAALNAAERELQVPHGQVTWTAHRALRRSLEHAWEHLREIERRTGAV